jgi:protein polybromo-1
MYDEINRQIRKLPVEGIKKFFHSTLVTEDEIYYFPKLINPPKTGLDMSQVQSDIGKSQNTPIHMEVVST